MRGHPGLRGSTRYGRCCRGCLGKWYGIPAGRPDCGRRRRCRAGADGMDRAPDGTGVTAGTAITERNEPFGMERARSYISTWTPFFLPRWSSATTRPCGTSDRRGARRTARRGLHGELRGTPLRSAFGLFRRPQARRLCPDLIFVPARFEVYKAVSQQIRAIFPRIYRPGRTPVAGRSLSGCLACPFGDARGAGDQIADPGRDAPHGPRPGFR